MAIFSLQLDRQDRERLDAIVRAAPGPTGDCYDLERDKESIHAKIMHMNQNTGGAPAHIDMSPDVASVHKPH